MGSCARAAEPRKRGAKPRKSGRERLRDRTRFSLVRSFASSPLVREAPKDSPLTGYVESNLESGALFPGGSLRKDGKKYFSFPLRAFPLRAFPRLSLGKRNLQKKKKRLISEKKDSKRKKKPRSRKKKTPKEKKTPDRRLC